MYGIYANIWGILMVNVTVPYIAYMYPMGQQEPKKHKSQCLESTGWIRSGPQVLPHSCW